MAVDISSLLVWVGPHRQRLAGRVDARVVQGRCGETMMLLLAGLFIAAALGLRLFLAVAPSLRLIDHPNARSLHAVPTAVGGGAVPMALLSLVIVMASQLPHAGSGGVVMIWRVAGGWLDEWRGIPSSIRLLCYVVRLLRWRDRCRRHNSAVQSDFLPSVSGSPGASISSTLWMVSMAWLSCRHCASQSVWVSSAPSA